MGEEKVQGELMLSFFCTLNEGKQWRKLVLCEDRRKDLRVCVWEVYRKDLGFLYKGKRDTLRI